MNNTSTSSQFGFITILGRPNAGKSTLLNAIIGQKISAVSQKPQTTRNRLVGLKIFEQCQFAFVDTPGLHSPNGMPYINSAMVRTALNSASDADLILYLIDIQSGLNEQDINNLKTLADDNTLLILSKLDKVNLTIANKIYNETLNRLDGSSELKGKKFKVVTGSSKSKNFINGLLFELSKSLPKGPWLYPSDQCTDISENLVCSELIREQLFRCLGQELPYSVGVLVERVSLGETHVNVQCKVVVAKDSHKAMILGKRGEKIKEIGIGSRLSIENFFKKKVNLKIFVANSENWVNSPAKVNEIQNLSIDN